MKEWIIRGSLLVGSLLIFFFGIEFGLRVTGLQSVRPNPPKIYQESENATISYELKPNIEEKAYHALVTTNALGFRSPEIPEGKKLLAVLGDSVAFGYGVEDGETLASRLNETSSDWFFLNAAVPGYNLSQEIETFERNIRPFNPDGLMIVFFWNDLDGLPTGILDEDGILRGGDWVPGSDHCEPIEKGILGLIPGKCWLDTHSAFYKAFKKLVNLIHGRAQLREDRENANEGTTSDPSKMEELSAYLDRLSSFSRTLPARTERIFVIWPDRFLHDETKPALMGGARRAGFTVFDLYELFGNEVPTLPWDTVHPNAEAIARSAIFIGSSLLND